MDDHTTGCPMCGHHLKVSKVDGMARCKNCGWWG